MIMAICAEAIAQEWRGVWGGKSGVGGSKSEVKLMWVGGGCTDDYRDSLT